MLGVGGGNLRRSGVHCLGNCGCFCFIGFPGYPRCATPFPGASLGVVKTFHRNFCRELGQGGHGLVNLDFRL